MKEKIRYLGNISATILLLVLGSGVLGRAVRESGILTHGLNSMNQSEYMLLGVGILGYCIFIYMAALNINRHKTV